MLYWFISNEVASELLYLPKFFETLFSVHSYVILFLLLIDTEIICIIILVCVYMDSYQLTLSTIFYPFVYLHFYQLCEISKQFVSKNHA